MIQKVPLPEHLINYKVPFGPIGKPVYDRTYSHFFEDGTKETWPHSAVRAIDGNLGLVSPRFHEDGEREKLIELLLPFAALPAGRHLYASGVKGRQFLFNCHASGWDKNEPALHFSFLFDQLMQGGGVGANYSNRYIDDMPVITAPIDLHVICRPNHTNLNEFSHLLSTHVGHGIIETMIVDDSREGWVDSVDLLFKRAFAGTDDEKSLAFDVSLIRDKGAPLVTSGGIACGPAPLVAMLIDLVKIINGAVGRKLTSLECMMLDHILASCVVAGGKRRSSRMSVKNWKDVDIFSFVNCKSEDGAHWSTNISVEVDDEFQAAYAAGDKHARAVMRQVVLGKRANGEPGLWNISLARKGEREPWKVYCPNPCGEICLYMWENCNLGHVFMGFFAGKRPEEMYEAFRLMSRWLVRATFGDIPQPRQREVMDQNRRIGVGFFGFHEWLAMYGIRYSACYKSQFVIDTLEKAHATVVAEGTKYAKELGISVPVKFTTLAPTGSIASMPGATTSAQCMIAPYFKRLVRYSENDPELHVKIAEGYEVFKDPDARNTMIVVYWCEDPLVTKVRNAGFDPSELLEGQHEISFQDSLQIQKMVQTHYADNAVSFTINVRPDDMPPEEEMEAMLMDVLPSIKGVTVFPDKSRRNAPIQPISKEEFEAYQGRKEVAFIEDVCIGACPVK